MGSYITRVTYCSLSLVPIATVFLNFTLFILMVYYDIPGILIYGIITLINLCSVWLAMHVW